MRYIRILKILLASAGAMWYAVDMNIPEELVNEIIEQLIDDALTISGEWGEVITRDEMIEKGHDKYGYGDEQMSLIAKINECL